MQVLDKASNEHYLPLFKSATPINLIFQEDLESSSLSASYSEDMYLHVPIIYTLWFKPLPAKVKMNHLTLQ